MTFLAPWMLLGGLAAGVPIALHLLHRGHPKTRHWAAMEFLRKSLKDTSRRVKFRNLLLLLARVLACLLAALALARPAASWLPSWSATEAVIVLDTSASMAARERGSTRMEMARREARTFLESLPTGSRARIIATSDGIDNPGEPPRSPLRAAADIETITPSDRPGDIAAGLAEAIDHLRGSTLPAKALLVISDLQPSGWERGAARIRQEMDRLPPGTAVRVRQVGEPEGTNLQLIDASPAAGFVVTGPRQLWLLRVRNGGTVHADDVVARMGFVSPDGSVDDAEAVSLGRLAPGEERLVEVGLSAGDAPWARMAARVTGANDRFDRDDTFYRATRVRPRLGTLVVGSTSPRDKTVNLGVYWHQAVEAINPIPGSANVKTTLLTPEAANRAELDAVDMVVLAGLPSDGGGLAWESLVNRLEPWIRAGGTVVVAPRASGTTKPSTWLAPLVTAGPVNAASVDLGSLAGTSLSTFASPPLDALGRLSILTPCSTEALPGGRVLARLNGGAGVVSVSPLGEGAVAVIGLGSTPEEGDLVLHPLFVPLAQSVVSEALGRAEAGRRTPWFARPEDPTAEFAFTGPQGAFVPARLRDDGLVVPDAEPKVAGFWTMAPRHGPSAPASDFAHNTDPVEGTNWAPLTGTRVGELLGREAALDDPFLLASAGGPEALGWILVVLLLVLVGESALAWWTGRPA